MTKMTKMTNNIRIISNISIRKMTELLYLCKKRFLNRNTISKKKIHHFKNKIVIKCPSKIPNKVDFYKKKMRNKLDFYKKKLIKMSNKI